MAVERRVEPGVAAELAERRVAERPGAGGAGAGVGRGAGVHPLLALQRQAGNRAAVAFVVQRADDGKGKGKRKHDEGEDEASTSTGKRQLRERTQALSEEMRNKFRTEWRSQNTAGALLWHATGGASAGEGKCDARITFTTRRAPVDGAYDDSTGIHAEIDALSKVGAAYRNKIRRITISSPPCPRCSVILEGLDLSAKVWRGSAPQRSGPSWGWPSTGSLGDLWPKLLPTELEGTVFSKDAKTEIARMFFAGSWHT